MPHNFKSCRECGIPIRGNRFYCDSVDCQRAAAAARKANSRAKAKNAATAAPSVPVVPVAGQSELDAWRAAELAEWGVLGPALGWWTETKNGDDRFAFMLEREQRDPLPIPPPSEWGRFPALVAEFEAFRAARA